MTDLLSTLALIGFAELGDKTQLVCLALSARYRPGPVVAGAFLAFSFLNGLAVAVGAALGAVIPETAVRLTAAGLFAVFGVAALLHREDRDDAGLQDRPGSPILVTAALLTIAELGDKTQLAVAALATVQSPAATWLGATLALVGTSAAAAAVGRWLLPRLPDRLLSVATGLLFLAVAAWLVATLPG